MNETFHLYSLVRCSRHQTFQLLYKKPAQRESQLQKSRESRIMEQVLAKLEAIERRIKTDQLQNESR